MTNSMGDSGYQKGNAAMGPNGTRDPGPNGVSNQLGSSEKLMGTQAKSGSHSETGKMELEERRPSGVIEERNGTFVMKKKKDWVPENDQKAFESLMLEEEEMKPEKDEFEGDFSRSGVKNYSSNSKQAFLEYESEESSEEDEGNKRKPSGAGKAMPPDFIQKTKMAISGQFPKPQGKLAFEPRQRAPLQTHAELRQAMLREQQQKEKRKEGKIDLTSDNEESLSDFSRSSRLPRSTDLSKFSDQYSRRTESSKLTNPLTPPSIVTRPGGTPSIIGNQRVATVLDSGSRRDTPDLRSSSGTPGGASLASGNMSSGTPVMMSFGANPPRDEGHPMMQQQLFTNRVQRNQQGGGKLDGSFKRDLEYFF